MRINKEFIIQYICRPGLRRRGKRPAETMSPKSPEGEEEEEEERKEEEEGKKEGEGKNIEEERKAEEEADVDFCEVCPGMKAITSCLASCCCRICLVSPLISFPFLFFVCFYYLFLTGFIKEVTLKNSWPLTSCTMQIIILYV